MVSKIPEGLISETEVFDSNAPITKLIPAVQKYDAVIVNKGSDYFGIVDSRILYRELQNLRMAKTQKAERFVVRVPRITDSTSIDDVVYYFHKARTRALPYSKDGKVRGILTRQTMLKVLLSEEKLKDLKVSDAMVSPLIGIELKSNVTQAKRVMRDNKINRLAVFDGDKFVGLVTNYDLLGNVATPQERLPQRKSYMYNPSNISLDNIMQPNPQSIDYSRSLNEAIRVLVERGISSLVVLKSNKPVGVLTELDVISRAMASGSGGPAANKVIISGLDQDTLQYEDEIRDSLKSFVEKVERMSNMEVDYISVVVKKFKTNSYEIHARLSLGRNGIINTSITGHLFERTMRDLLDILAKDVRKMKERYLTVRKVLHNAHPEEEL